MIRWLSPGRWFGLIGVLFAGLLALGTLRRGAKQKSDLRTAKEVIQTREKIDEALADSRRSGGFWHDRLRRHVDGR